MFYTETTEGGINYVYLGSRLIAKDGVIPENGNKQHYLPFGASVEGEINDVGYTGHKFDKDIGLSYMQARYYDPVLGRFMSPDPIGSADQFNLFAYVHNDPINKIDPTGNFAVLLLFAPEIILAAKATLFVGSAVTVAAVASDAIDTNGESTPEGNEGSTSGEESGFTDTPGNKTPWTGEPGSTVRGGTGSRTYGDDGYPAKDRDLPHPNEAGTGNEDHVHDWDRPSDGSPPTNENRGNSRPPLPGDPPVPRGPNVPPPEIKKIN